MVRGKGDGKGNDGQGGRWSEERGTVKRRRKRERWTVDKDMMERGKGDVKGNDGQGGRRSEERGTVKRRRKRERWTVEKGDNGEWKLGRYSVDGKGDDGEWKGGR